MNEEERLKKRDIIRWDFSVEANDPRAFELIPTIEKLMDVPTTCASTTEKRQQKKEDCNDCKYRQAVDEILNILKMCKIVKESEAQDQQKEKGYSIEVK